MWLFSLQVELSSKLLKLYFRRSEIHCLFHGPSVYSQQHTVHPYIHQAFPPSFTFSSALPDMEMPLLHVCCFLLSAPIFICLASFTELTGLWLCPPLMGTSKEFIAMAIDKTPHSSPPPLYFVLIVSGQQAGTECWESFLKRFYRVCVIPHWHTSFHTSMGCFGCQTHVLRGHSTQTNIELTLFIFFFPVAFQWGHTLGDIAGRTPQAGSSPILASWH